MCDVSSIIIIIIIIIQLNLFINYSTVVHVQKAEFARQQEHPAEHTITFNVKILSYFPRRIYWYLWISCDSHNKGKGHAMTCLCRRRRETELQFQHIHNLALGGGECQHHAPTV